MGGTMTKVLHSLYIGGLENAKNEGELIANCISHILVVQTAKKELEDQSPSRQYLHICIAERDKRSLIRRIPETNTFIHRARSESGNVLVCSESGISANIAVVAAYLMTVYSLDSRSAVSAVRGLQHAALPIPALFAQLDRFNSHPGEAPRDEGTSERARTLSSNDPVDLSVTADVERRRLKDTFGDWPGYEEDLQQLLEAIRSFKSLSDSGVLLRDPTSPLPEMWAAASPTDLEVSSSLDDTLAQASNSTATSRSTRSNAGKGLTRSRVVKLTPPSTPPTTPVCFTGNQPIGGKAKTVMAQNTESSAVASAGDLSDQETADFPKLRDCSPPITLNEADLFPGDAPIISIDDFALRYSQKVNSQRDYVQGDTGDHQSTAPYEIGVEVTGDLDANYDEDDDVPGAIEIRTGLGGRQSLPRAVATSYHVGLPVYASSRQRVSGQQVEPLPSAHEVAQRALGYRRFNSDSGTAGSGRLSTTVPVLRSFLPF